MSDEIKELTEEAEVRRALEEARTAESSAYSRMSHAAALTERQKGMLELAKLEEESAPDSALLDRKCRLILENYYLPHILRDGYEVKLKEGFTRHDEPERDYIEAVFTSPSGKEKSIGYNYKTDEDGKDLILFEKTFENVVLKPGDPEKYVLYDADGETEIESVSTEELKERLAAGEVVKVEEEYFQKERNKDGELCEGVTTVIVEDESDGDVKILFGNNEQEKYSFSKTGQLVCATTNDVTTVTIENRKLANSGAVFGSADEARAAAEKELQEGETNLRVDVVMEGTTVAAFNFLPAYTTSIELAGLSRKLGKGIEGYNPQESDEENLRIQLAKPISEYLVEKGFYVMDITCENLEADVKENVGFMNTIKTFQMTGGTVSVTYIKKLTSMVTLKQGFLSRGQSNDTSVILSQLPAGSELLPQEINWKSSKVEVAYVVREDVTGVGSAKTIAEADEKAVENAILEAQKLVVRGINGGIASGIREAIAARGAVSTVTSVRAKLDVPHVSKDDMQLTHKDAKYSYSGNCDRMVTSVENKLVSVTTWNGSRLTYVEPTEPIIDRGIPTDENYDLYVSEGDDSGILLFEKSDPGLHRYMDEVRNAQKQAKLCRRLYRKAYAALQDAQDAFDRIIDAKLTTWAEDMEAEEPELEETAEPEGTMELEEAAEPEGTTKAEESELEETAELEGTTEAEEPELEEAAELEETKELEGTAEPEKTAEPEEPEAEGTTEPSAMEPAGSETSGADAGNPQKLDLQSDEDVDAAFARLLMGIPKE